MDILHCSSEVAPFSKTGGLADVASALPEALTRLGHKVTVVTPLYASIDRDKHGVRPTGRSFDVTLGGRTRNLEVFEAHLPQGTHVVLLGCESLFGREELYGTRDGDYPDNHLRFAFFSAAVFRLMRSLRIRPSVLHCHDWQTGLVPAYNRLFHLDLCGTVLTVHNLAYQGLFPADVVPDIGLPWEIFNPEGVEFYGNVNFLKAGLVYSDRITTVSPGYAGEILTEQFGCGLDGVLRGRGKDVVGILNGVDYQQWSPLTDKLIPDNYGPDDLSGKKACRQALLGEFGLEPSFEGPVFGVVGRLAAQKGFDLLAEVLPDLVEMGAAVVILGTGERAVEENISEAARRFPRNVSARIAYDNGLAHRIEAGSDFFLMPSRYEPCGLNQIYSMKYGTIPVVHAVGGLEDTVIDIKEEPERGTGLKFREFSAEAFLDALRRSVSLYADKRAMDAVIRRGMDMDFSWEASAGAYVDLYEQTID
ncbi:MAG: glycogen synthase GlgA [Deltaproteobacteria bacterium]|nr:glycogen synthase GlgA [Deltaproteobacteria bacterium]